MTLRIFYFYFYKVKSTCRQIIGCQKTCRLLTSVCWLSISWYRLDASTQLDIKIHQITNVQVLINVKKVVKKNDARPNAFFEMILAASVDKNWIPFDKKLLLVNVNLHSGC